MRLFLADVGSGICGRWNGGREDTHSRLVAVESAMEPAVVILSASCVSGDATVSVMVEDAMAKCFVKRVVELDKLMRREFRDILAGRGR